MTETPNLLLRAFIDELVSITGAKEISVQEQVAFGEHDRRLDALVRLRLLSDGDVDLAIEVLGTAYPRDIIQVIHQLQKYKATSDSPNRPVILAVVAEYLSPGARQELKEAGINFFDGTLSMYFRHRTYLLVREILGVEHKPRRPVRLFSGAREKVVHSLLEHWRTTMGREFISGGELSMQSQTSTYTVSSTMQELEREGWVDATGSGPGLRRRLAKPEALLDAWAEDWTSRKETRSRWHVYAPSNLVDTMLIKLQEYDGWALTGAAAANAVAPHLTSVDRVQVIVPVGKAQAWAEQLKLKRAELGSNVTFIEREGASLMFLDEHPEQPSSRFAGRFIQYLDLLDGYGRDKELAEEFRRRALRMGSRK
jgi:hypothetical protein